MEDPTTDNMNNDQNNNLLTPAQVERLIDQRVADAIARHDAARAAETAKGERKDQGNPLF